MILKNFYRYISRGDFAGIRKRLKYYSLNHASYLASCIGIAIKPPLIYDNSFFFHNFQNNKKIVPLFVDVVLKRLSSISINSCIDWGCGEGSFLREFALRGINGFGLDGSNYAVEHSVTDQTVVTADITKPVFINHKYSLAICIEVAEHIPKRRSDVLIKNITRSADIILFSAAPPGQGGTAHINEQPFAFWVNLFKKESFGLDAKTTDRVKADLRNHLPVDLEHYLIQNISIFRKEQE